MTNIQDNFKINLNQNLWGLLICLISLGLSEYFHLCTLYYISLILSCGAGLSFLLTLGAYTIKYIRSKFA
jgi:hypothetical protein